MLPWVGCAEKRESTDGTVRSRFTIFKKAQDDDAG